MARAEDGGAVAAPPLADRQIRDLASFNGHTTEAREVAGLYAYMHLDGLVDLARLISIDFFARPQMYRDVGGAGVAQELARLRARYGCDESFLSSEQRHAIFAAIFGEAEAGGAALGTADGAAAADSFAGLRDQVLAAAAAFAERVYDTGEQMLRDRVRLMHIGLKDYLQDVSGASVHWSRDEGLSAITEPTSYDILRNPRIAAVFGLAQAPQEAWPYREDANGTRLVEQISNQLGGGSHPMSREGFICKQRLALRGAEAIAAVLDFNDGDPDANLDLLITKCYTWHAARGRVLGAPIGVAPGAVAPAAAAPAATAGMVDAGNRGLYGEARVGVS